MVDKSHIVAPLESSSCPCSSSSLKLHDVYTEWDTRCIFWLHRSIKVKYSICLVHHVTYAVYVYMYFWKLWTLCKVWLHSVSLGWLETNSKLHYGHSYYFIQTNSTAESLRVQEAVNKMSRYQSYVSKMWNHVFISLVLVSQPRKMSFKYFYDALMMLKSCSAPLSFIKTLLVQ